MPYSPGVVVEGGRRHLVAKGVHIGGVALSVLVPSGLAQLALAAGRGQAKCEVVNFVRTRNLPPRKAQFVHV